MMENRETTQTKDFKMKWGATLYLMEQDVIDYLKEKEKGYGYRKKQISKGTGIPLDILTPILKRLKYQGYIELIMIWSEDTGLPDGSGYIIKNGLRL